MVVVFYRNKVIEANIFDQNKLMSLTTTWMMNPILQWDGSTNQHSTHVHNKLKYTPIHLATMEESLAAGLLLHRVWDNHVHVTHSNKQAKLLRLVKQGIVDPPDWIIAAIKCLHKEWPQKP
jgi:hypothetical protein